MRTGRPHCPPTEVNPCADRTGADRRRGRHRAGHLRLRGENPASGTWSLVSGGLPPPARRERGLRYRPDHPDRTTSACAERTVCGSPAGCPAPDHLRLRGENAAQFAFDLGADGPPPPARREPSATRDEFLNDRTTFACAERTRRRCRAGCGSADHLRLRGENLDTESWATSGYGPPPPARRELGGARGALLGGRTTSACAERTLKRRRDLAQVVQASPETDKRARLFSGDLAEGARLKCGKAIDPRIPEGSGHCSGVDEVTDRRVRGWEPSVLAPQARINTQHLWRALRRHGQLQNGSTVIAHRITCHRQNVRSPSKLLP